MGVLVIGAGPTGLVLACALRQFGVDVTVLDRADGPATTSRALVLQPRGVEVLHRAGALGDLADRALGVRQLRLYAGGHPVLDLPVDGRARVISQADVEAALRARLAELGGTIEWGVRLTGATSGRDGVTAAFDGAPDRTADWLIGCDGAHSAVRRAAGIGFPGGAVAERFLLADVRADWPVDRSGTSSWLHPDGMFTLFPLTGGRWRLIADAPPTDTTDVLAELLRAAGTRAGLTGLRVEETLWTSTFRIHRRLAERYRAGRLLLAGDAAHVHSPFGGQGLNTGIGDAENLAWKLALVLAGRAEPALLDSYPAERRPVAAAVLDDTTGVTRLLLAPQPLVRLARDRVLLPLVRRPLLRRRVLERGSQLGVSYRRGPLGGGRGPGVRPGDRVPDVACVDEHGAPVALHTALRGRWALLLATPDPALAADVRKYLGPALTVLTPARPLPAPALLIRPDAHLAYRGPAAPGKLTAWLDRTLNHRPR